MSAMPQMENDRYKELQSDKDVLRLLVDFLRRDKVRLLEQASLASRNSARLAMLYAAVDELYSSPDRVTVLEAIEDIVVNVIGAAQYTLVEGEGEPGAVAENALARIPLKVGDQVFGVIAIFALKDGKTEFSATDRELFDILTRHAAIALRSSS